MAAPRDPIVAFCEQFLPETTKPDNFIHWNQVGFDNLAKDYGQGFGTTCGFLPHYLLWRFGCRDNTLVNRSAPVEGLSYHISQNLSLFQPGRKQPRPSWTALDNEQKTRDAIKPGTLKPGDFVIIRGDFWKNKATNVRDIDSSHIFVFLKQVEASGNKVKWRVAQSGQNTNARMQAAHITTLTGELREGEVMDLGKPYKGPNLVFIANIDGEEPNFPRRVVGYTNLDAVSFGAASATRFHQLVDERWRKTTTNNPMKVNPWMGWYEVSSPGGFIMANKTFVLLHRGHEAYRLERTLGPYFCTARGLWTLDGTTVDVVWDDGSDPQSWSMATTFVPRIATTGTPRTPHTGTLTRVQQVPPKKVPAEIMPNWLVE